MQRFFIADIHLNHNEPVITTGFLQFLTQLPEHCELYVLGDLFDYWIGDDVNTPLHQQIANGLNELSKRAINVYFIHGNRDFLLGSRYAKQCHMQLLPEVQLLDIKNNNLLILHGDQLCIDDQAYQRFRRKMHNKWLQRLFLILPLSLRQIIARKLRTESYQHNQVKSSRIMDVNQKAVEEMLDQYQATIMIHGHTHKPAVHHFLLHNKPAKRLVLGAWHEGISYIYQDENGELDLHQLPFNNV